MERYTKQNLRFQGQYFDAEPGLHYNTFRYYDPVVGRFVGKDPRALAGGTNLYQYAASTLESDIATYIKKNGAVDVDISFIYKNGGTRPISIIYDEYQNDSKIINKIFSN
ncbi:RHS repeat-associated core domain-containing protein [Pseudomonas sp. JH-2]|uniref:RHS repeat-associated core domain-containing protein n=1 Tax=Pseudomonas sp. JH-2 TaxID=3114998 RepID=UPI003FA738BF